MSRRTLTATALAVLLLSPAPLYADDAEDGAVMAVEKLGGSAVRDGTDPARPVVAVSFVAVPVTDRELRCLAAMKQLRTLNLAVCLGVTDAGLKRLAALKGLRSLNLRGDRVTADGVAALRKALPDCKIDR